MPHRTLPEQISQLKDEIRRETDPDLKQELLLALRHFYGVLVTQYENDSDDSIDNGTRDEEQTSLDIFISHSSTDVKIAAALIELLRAALPIPAENIRCTSVEGHMLDAGVSVNEQLRLEIHQARSFIGLITPDSLESTYVLFELGARWGANLHLIPALVSLADKSLLQEPLKSLNTVCCARAAQLHQLMENIASALNVECGGAATYQKYVDKLVRKSKASEKARSLI